MSWFSLMVSALAECKRDDLARGRLDFDAAWWACERRYPPAAGIGSVTTLFDEQGERHVTANEFFKRVARNAYEDRVELPSWELPDGDERRGNGPSLRYFRTDMTLALDLDESGPARRSTLSQGRIRQAA